MAEKYDAPLVLECLLVSCLPHMYEPDKPLNDHSRASVSRAINAFGIAIAFRKPVHTRAALRSLDKYKPDQSCDDLDDESNEDNERPVIRAKEFNLSHLYDAILTKMPTRDIAEFCRVAGKIGPTYSWAQAARDFKASGFRSRVALCHCSDPHAFLALVLTQIQEGDHNE